MEAVDRLFAAYFEQGVAPGMAYGVVVDGKLVHSGGMGTLRVGEQALPGKDSVFRIASMTKSFIAATILLLRDEGVLQLDDRAEKWVPELLGVPLPTGDSAPPTLRQLLSMNGGLPEDDPWADRMEHMSDSDLTALLSEPKTWSAAPGAGYEYSNLGYVILGRVIQNASGQNFREVVTERIIKPLGLVNTGWREEEVDAQQLAAGYARTDDAGHAKGTRSAMSSHADGKVWAVQPVQTAGAFSALGGLYSSVSDLAIWVSGFLDAWPPRDDAADADADADAEGVHPHPHPHPLCRASRREMQHVAVVLPIHLGGGGSRGGLARAQVEGYCLGLKSHDSLTAGRIVGHSGGYPGFGSRMDWHPAAGVGVIGLANGRYGGPYVATRDAVAAVVAGLGRSAHEQLQPHRSVASIRSTIDQALVSNDFNAITPLFSGNVAMDEALGKRAATVAALAGAHGRLTPEPGVTVRTATQVSWWLAGQRGRVGISITLTPHAQPQVQVLNITSVMQPSTPLEDAASASLVEVRSGTNEFSSLLLPIRRTSWVECDSDRRGTLLIEGSAVKVRLRIDLDQHPAASFRPE